MAIPSRSHQASQPRACTRQNISVLALLLLMHSLCPADAFLLPSHSPPTTHPSSSLQPYLTSTGTGSRTALGAKSGKKKNKSKDTTITINRIAYRNYEIVDTLEAGVALLGTEVKAIRDGKMNLRDGYIRPSKNGRSCVLHNVHIGKHSMAGAYFQHEEKRPRVLLVHKEQARKFLQQTEQQGMTIIPLKAYFSDFNMVKIQIALCRGKNVRDKRVTIKERDAKREENRIIKSFRV
jgi:SsrA-binding protein